MSDKPVDAVNPEHYRYGPWIKVQENVDIYEHSGRWSRHIKELGHSIFFQVECIDIFRHIKDPRLATAFQYLWRVAFGGKKYREPGQTQRAKNQEDIKKAIWYLEDWLSNESGT